MDFPLINPTSALCKNFPFSSIILYALTHMDCRFACPGGLRRPENIRCKCDQTASQREKKYGSIIHRIYS